MDRHMRDSLDHWLTTPPEQDEPENEWADERELDYDERAIIYEVEIAVNVDHPPGDNLRIIEEALREKGLRVIEVSWEAQFLGE